MSATTDLAAQIAAEQKQIENAPKVPVRFGTNGRCGWCGRLADDLVPVHDYGPTGKIINERYKGIKCCGARHV